MPRPTSSAPGAAAPTRRRPARRAATPRLRPRLAALLALAAAAAAPRGASAHAVMIDPPSRPWMDYLVNYNYNPHAVFAGGVAAVSKNETLVWPAANKAGVCGDAVGERKWGAPGPIRRTYTAGQTFDADVLFAQNHLGYWRLRVCPLDARDESQCRDVPRADGKGSAVSLVWTKGWHGVTSGFEPPLGLDGFTVHKLPAIGKGGGGGEGCAAWACDQFRGMYYYRSSWRLPDGLKCAHCALQFAYTTGSRCWPPCLPDAKDCKPKPVDYPYCGAPGASYPEMFWGCADIAIV